MINNDTSNIAILLSTYNGEKFIKKQIDSLIAQTFSNWKLYIRDDGSTDKTISIIDGICESDNRIFLYKETNIGVKASFLSLLSRVEADYYFFCDQDDIWHSDKIEKTMELACKSKREPLLIHGNMSLIDDDGNILTDRLKKDNLYTKFYSIMKKNNVTGCTMMINNQLKKKCYLSDKKEIVMHDWWLGLYASYYGNIMYINNPIMDYRKHANNVMGTEYKMINKLAKLLPIEIENMRLSKGQLQLFRALENIKDYEVDLYLAEPNSLIKKYKKSVLIAKQNSTFVGRIISFVVNMF